MRKLIQLLVVILLAAFVLPSCNSSLGITKRRYTKGYFVQHNSGKHQVKKNNEAVSKNSGEETQQQAEEFRAIDYVKSASEPETVNEKKEIMTASAAKTKSLTKDEKKELRAQAVELAVKHPVKAIKRVGELAQDEGDKALSLLWIVVVVILIVYLLGVLLEWGSGSGLIHILGIIALVLLILWLLRIL